MIFWQFEQSRLDVKFPMTVVGDLIFMVGDLTKTDFPAHRGAFDNMINDVTIA